MLEHQLVNRFDGMTESSGRFPERTSQSNVMLVSAREACDILRCSKSHFYKVLVRDGYIKERVRHGRRTYFHRHEIEALSAVGWI